MVINSLPKAKNFFLSQILFLNILSMFFKSTLFCCINYLSTIIFVHNIGWDVGGLCKKEGHMWPLLAFFLGDATIINFESFWKKLLALSTALVSSKKYILTVLLKSQYSCIIQLILQKIKICQYKQMVLRPCVHVWSMIHSADTK